MQCIFSNCNTHHVWNIVGYSATDRIICAETLCSVNEAVLIFICLGHFVCIHSEFIRVKQRYFYFSCDICFYIISWFSPSITFAFVSWSHRHTLLHLHTHTLAHTPTYHLLLLILSHINKDTLLLFAYQTQFGQ